MFWLSLGIGLFALGTFIKHAYFDAPTKPNFGNPQAFQISATEEGVPIPLVYGTIRVDNPIMVWCGNATALPPDVVESNGLPGGDLTETVNGFAGFVYGIDMTFVIAVPAYNAPVYIKRIWWGDTVALGFDGSTLFSPGQTPFLVKLGDGVDVVGTLEFFAGTSTQNVCAPSTLTYAVMTSSGADMTLAPGYRNQVVVTLNLSGKTGGCSGASPQIPQISFEIVVDPQAADPSQGMLPTDALIDLFTNPVWHTGLTSADLDVAGTWAAVATTLTNEGSYFSGKFDTKQDASQLIGLVLKQINGVIYQDPQTGLICIRLIRADYNPATIPTVGVDDVLPEPEYSVTTQAETYNQIRVTFPDRVGNYQQGAIIAQNLGAITAQKGRLRTLEMSYPGVTSSNAAVALGARDLAVVDRPLRKLACTLTRKFYATLPGDVLSVTLPKYGLSGVVFRVLPVDTGQLADRGIRVTLLEDVFTHVGSFGLVFPPLLASVPEPLTNTLWMEAPRWWALQLPSVQVLFQDPDAPVSLGVATPDDSSGAFRVDSRGLPLTIFQSQQFNSDVPQQLYPASFTLVNNYARTLEPYDTTSNLLVIQSLIGWTSSTPFTSSGATDGTAQIALVNASGQVEIVSYESVTSLGGGQYRLNNVWRALLDTVPVDHLAGERGYVLSVNAIGRDQYNIGKNVQGRFVPTLNARHSSGDDTIDSYTVACRSLRPLRPANQGIGGDAIIGTLGIPAVANRNKVAALLEEGVDLYGSLRDRFFSTIVRGDAGGDTLNENDLLVVVASLGGTILTNAMIAGGAQTFAGAIGMLYQRTVNPDFLVTPEGSASGVLCGALWQLDGFGSLDVGAYSSFIPSTYTGKYGTTSLNWPQFSYSVPRVNVFAPSWRNLLTNVRWNYQYTGLGSSSGSSWPPGWDDGAGASGQAAVTSSLFSMTGLASGNGSYWLAAASGVTTLTREQYAPLSAFQPSSYNFDDPKRPSNWYPRGLVAVFVCYIRNANSNATDTGQLTLTAYERILVGWSTLTSASSTATAGPTGNWLRQVVTLTLPALTSEVGAKIAGAHVSGSPVQANTAFSEAELRVGQWAGTPGTSLLGDYSLATGTGWTTDSGTMTFGGTLNGGGAVAQQSASFAWFSTAVAGQVHQDYSLPTGFEYGTAILTVWVNQGVGANHPQVKLEALNASNAVLATADTGALTVQAPGNGQWQRYTLYLDMPDAAAKVRVILIGNWTASTNFAAFDEVVLWYTKHLDASSSLSLTFDTPTVQPTPVDWQQYHRAYPSLTIPEWVYGGEAPVTIDSSLQWSDGGTRAAAAIMGQFGGGVTSIGGYGFTRTSGGGLICAEITGAAQVGSSDTTASFSLAQPFTAMCFFRVDEPSFSVACGLAGRMSTALGWGLNITAGGQAQAMLRGAGNTQKQIATGRSIVEGGLHMAAIVNDGAGTLWIYDETGGVSVSTAGLGEIAAVGTDPACFFRIGTDAPDHASLPGQIGRVFVWNVALSSGQIAQHWNYAKDPTAQLTTYTRTAAAIVPIAPDSAGNAQAYVAAAAQVALPYAAELVADGGTGYGLAVGKSATNLIPDVNFAGANWVAESSVTLTQGIVDPTGRPRGVQVTASGLNDGFYAQNVPLAASPATVPLIFWAMGVSGGTTLTVELRTSTGTLVSSTTVTLTMGVWKQFAVTLGSWAGATANARIRFVLGNPSVFNLAGIVCALQGTDFPAILPLPGATHGNYNAQVASGSFPKQFTYEGELIAQGVGMINSPTPAAGTILQATVGSNANLRELQVISGSTGFRCVHYDSASAHTDATTAYSTYASAIWKARARWALCGMLDNTTPQDFSAVAWTDSANPTPTVSNGRTAAWTITAVAPTTLNIGAGTASPSDVVLRNVTMRAREEKLV